MFKPKTKEELELELAELRRKVQENIEMNKLKEEIDKIKHPIKHQLLNAFSKQNLGKKIFP